MASVYDLLADTCAALAAKTKHQTDQVRLRQLVEQWRSVGVDQESEAIRRPFALLKPTEPVPAKTLAPGAPRRKGGRPKKKEA